MQPKYETNANKPKYATNAGRAEPVPGGGRAEPMPAGGRIWARVKFSSLLVLLHKYCIGMRGHTP